MTCARSSTRALGGSLTHRSVVVWSRLEEEPVGAREGIPELPRDATLYVWPARGGVRRIMALGKFYETFFHALCDGY